MNTDKIKQSRELLNIRPLLYRMELMPNESMCSDKPDICLPSMDNRIIGIEIVNYTHSSVNKNISSFNKLLQEYCIYFDSKKNTEKCYSQHSYRIKVWLPDGGYPNEPDYRKAKDSIFQELDAFLFPNSNFIKNNYIASVEVEECKSLDKTKAEVIYVVQYQEVDDILLLSYIKRKEKKLSDYKSLPENQTIERYWLSICFPEHEQVDIKDYALSSDFKSEYDCIFLIKGADYKMIWNKGKGSGDIILKETRRMIYSKDK